jgi:hypothetical protein
MIGGGGSSAPGGGGSAGEAAGGGEQGGMGGLPFGLAAISPFVALLGKAIKDKSNEKP